MNCVTINGHDFYEVDGRLMPAISGGEYAIAIASIVATIAAAGFSAYAQHQAGQQQNAAAKYNAKVAENNQIAARQAAEIKANEIRQNNRMILARARNNALSNGGELRSGTSALDILAFDANQGELSALRAQYTGEVDVLGLEAQKRMYRFQGAQAAYAGGIGATSTLLGGLGQAGAMGYNMYSRPGRGGSGGSGSGSSTIYGPASA